MAYMLTYLRRYIYRCMVDAGSAYCIHNADCIDAGASDVRRRPSSGGVPRHQNLKTVA